MPPDVKRLRHSVVNFKIQVGENSYLKLDVMKACHKYLSYCCYLNIPMILRECEFIFYLPKNFLCGFAPTML